MKKIVLTLILSLLLCLMLLCIANAESVYLEPIPDELKTADDKFTHFVVFEEEKYFVGSGATLTSFNAEAMDADMASAGIDKSKIGKEYLTRFNFPATFGGTTVTYVNLNSMKGHAYFSHVCGYIQLCGTVNKLHDMNEKTSQLRCIDFGENSQVKSIPFYFCPDSRRLFSIKNFPRDLDVIEESAFNRCYNAFKGELYLNAKTIKTSAFNNSLSHLTGLVLGPNTQKIETQALCVRLSEIPGGSRPSDDKIQIRYIEFECDVSTVSFAEQKADSGAFYFPVNTGRSPYSHLKCIILSHPNNESKITEGSKFTDFTNGKTILFNDSDGADDFVVAGHNFENAVISYESYLENGVTSCVDCGKTIKYDPIFKFRGYSVPENGRISIVVGYEINQVALQAYEASTNKTITFGFIAVSKAKLGDNTPLDENGNPTALESGMVIKAEIEKGCRFLEGKIVGLTTDEHKAASLVLSMYALVLDSEGKTNVFYLQDKQAAGNELSSISYNELVSE